MPNSNHSDGLAFLRLGAAPCLEVFAGDEPARSRRIVLQDEVEVRLVLRGDVDVGSDGASHAAGAAMLMLLPARRLHATTAGAQGHSFIAFHLDQDALARLGPGSLAARGFACVDAPGELVALGLETQSLLAAGAISMPARLESLSRMLGDLVAAIDAEAPRVSASGPATRVASIERALSYLREHFMREISLQDLAAAAGLSKFHFVRLFAAVVGSTPHRYQLLLRISQARHLLRQGDEIADVAQRTGFFDQSHFTACFREVVGVTPGRYQSHPVNGPAAAPGTARPPLRGMSTGRTESLRRVS